jgi:hypothetical protein
MLLSTPSGRIDWPRMAQQFYEIGSLMDTNRTLKPRIASIDLLRAPS